MLGCEKNQEPQPIVYKGRFQGDIGKGTFDEENTPYKMPVKSKLGDGFELDVTIDGGNGEHRPGKYTYFHKMNLYLSEIKEGKTYNSFNGNLVNDKIVLLTHEETASIVLDKKYLAPKNKKSINISITNIDGTSVQGSINGFLYNELDLQDSISIDAKFVTD